MAEGGATGSASQQLLVSEKNDASSILEGKNSLLF